MKKSLFIACSQIQLLYAMQIKHTLLKNEDVDIVVMTTNCNIEPLKTVFNNVYWCDNNDAPKKGKVITCFLFPIIAMKKYYVNIDPSVYTDVFFWHPSWIYYFLYKYSKAHNDKYRWHIYPEGLAALIIKAEYVPPKKYGKGIIKKIIINCDRKKYKYGIDNMSKVSDIYLIQPKYSTVDYSYEAIDVPTFNKNDKDFIAIINEVFRYNHLDLHNRIIFIDGSFEGSRSDLYDNEYVDKLLVKLGEEYGREKILLKMHHRANKSLYSDQVKDSISFVETDFPWEIACINGDLEECTVVGTSSSALINPYIMFDSKIDAYIIDKIVNMKIKTNNRINELVDKIRLINNNDCLRVINDENELFYYLNDGKM